MKLKTLWASLFALLALTTACSKDSSVPTVNQAPKTREVNVSLSAVQDEDQARLIFGLSGDVRGTISGLQMAEKDVILRIAVRQGDGQALIQDVVFNKRMGSNYATYTGKITVPTGGTGAYKISSILLGEHNGKKFCQTWSDATTPRVMTDADSRVYYQTPLNSTLAEKNAEGKVELNVPYVTKWQDFVLSGDGTSVSSVTLNFEPQGTILRVRVKNTSGVDQSFSSVKFVGNAFAPGTLFYPARDLDGAMDYVYSNIESIVYRFPQTIKVESGTPQSPTYSSWYYAWVQPRKSLYSLSSTGNLNTGSVEAPVYVRAFQTTKALGEGSVPVTLNYSGVIDAEFGDLADVYDEWGAELTTPMNVLSYFAEYPLATGGTRLVTDHNIGNTDLGWFRPEEAVAMGTAPVVIDGVKYGTPTRDEFASVFSPVVDLSGVGADKFSLNTAFYDIQESNIKIGDVTQNYKADFLNTDASGVRVFYAIRFKSKSNYNRTAFRYEAQGARSNRSLRVDAIYLGPDKNLSVSDIANPEFWSARTSETVTRVFPLYGDNNPSVTPSRTGHNGTFSYATSTMFDRISIFYAGVPITGTGSVTMGTSTRLFTIYPIKR